MPFGQQIMTIKKNEIALPSIPVGKLNNLDKRVAALEAISVGTFSENETPAGTVNGSNKAFTVAHTPIANSLKVYVNGQRMAQAGVDYTLVTATITFVTAPPTGSVLIVDYRY